jgi:hypothetical protein
LSNPAALELLVLTEDQLVGKTFWPWMESDPWRRLTISGNTHPVPTEAAHEKRNITDNFLVT